MDFNDSFVQNIVTQMCVLSTLYNYNTTKTMEPCLLNFFTPQHCWPFIKKYKKSYVS